MHKQDILPKNLHVLLIDHTLHPMGHMSWIIFHLLGFLCNRDAGCRDNIITGIMTPIHSVSWLLLLNFIIWIIWLSAASQHSTKLILLPNTYYFHFKAVGHEKAYMKMAVMQGNSHDIKEDFSLKSALISHCSMQANSLFWMASKTSHERMCKWAAATRVSCIIRSLL